MQHNILLDIIGYIGSAIILSSFTMTSTVRLRIFNSIGGFINIIYSFLICAYPTAICNVCILCINTYYLLRVLHNHKDNYSIVPCAMNEGVYDAFIAKHADDIATYYPTFEPHNEKYNFARFIFSRNEIVGLQVGTIKGDAVSMALDYSIPEYRDCSVGRYAYSHIGNKGIKKAYFTNFESNTVSYLAKMGFTLTDNVLSKTLPACR